LPIVYSKLGIKKGNYDAIKMFQDFWVANLPWTWLFLRSKGNFHATKCKICSVVEKKNSCLLLNGILFVSMQDIWRLTKILGLVLRKGIGIIPKFVNMPRIENCMLPIVVKVLLPKL
jgi:hypothetical protein